MGDKKIIISVKTSTGQSYKLQVHGKNSIESIKRVLGQGMNCDPKLINLTYQNISLDSSLTIGQLNLQDNAEIRWVDPESSQLKNRSSTQQQNQKQQQKVDSKQKQKPKRQKSSEKKASDSQNPKGEAQKLQEKAKFNEKIKEIKKAFGGPLFVEEPKRPKPDDYEYRVHFLQNMCLPSDFIPAALEMANYDLEIAADALVNGDLPEDDDYSDSEIEEMYDSNRSKIEEQRKDLAGKFMMERNEFLQRFKLLKPYEKHEVNLLTNLGFDITTCLQIYLSCGKNRDKAIDQLAILHG
ncbi:hypothetical protein TVAG_269080 [Trichomonas vaginalis G3]|uniref:Ubiquitin-like domain-containing protein n=1 Tax=Trichomonas vaginalis (strain ATCC PRA-98 / G3) TaxID=412133 RepID=A2EG21_TRIV3|nr:UV excision repair protein RAD23 family [Trichomonas vaginalis G3]EAY08382.1 hypothetical protein TVAG_269080 [Trichomonas vaginalis G3]KAI5499338.1 UV excision repair protein RAD23 family [Trichomonas vaginalis G3]|eukprot:XP_001320605.1 hypothetical protein [Trichomonas vaginalis G3]